MLKNPTQAHPGSPRALSLVWLLAMVLAGSVTAQTLPPPSAYWFLDESAGVIAVDPIGDNDLALTGPAQWQPESGYVDGALSLGGNGAYGTRTDTQLGADIPGKLGTQTGDFTLSAWINPASLTDRNPILVKQGAPERGFMWSAGTPDGSGRLFVEVYKSNDTTSGKTELTSTAPLSIGVWQHVALTYRFVADGSSVLTLYIDGNQVGQTTTAVGPVRANDRPLDLGRYTWNAYQRFFNGLLDEVQVFNAALTAAQIQAVIAEANLQATNIPPVGDIAATPQSGNAPLRVSFDASGSYDPDGAIASYDWDFGDGATSTEIAPSHDYPAAGAYVATLVVTDNLGKIGRAEQTIRATDPFNSPPVARFNAQWNGVTVTLDATSSTDADGTIVSYQWSLGDGSNKTGQTVQHGYAQPGTYNVSLTVTDNSGGVGTVTKPVTFTAPELKVFEINRLVTKNDRGFPWDQPPAEAANGDWTSPINYAEGTLQMRAEIRGQPVAQAMKLQFCMWQYNLTLETCSSIRDVPGTPGTVVTWSSNIPTMYKKDGNPMDWENPRQRYGLSIKNSAGLPVSDFLGWNWNGENPDQWYPLDIRYTVVAVPPGKTFGGWTSDVLSAAPGYITDSTPPAIGPVSATAGQTSAVLSWTTNEPATATVLYGLSASYGIGEAESSALSTTHSVTLVGLSPGTTYHYRIDAFDAAGNTGATGDLTFSTLSEGTPAPAIVSDAFNQAALDTDVWTFVNPLGNATLSLNGAQVAIAVPGGSAHDIWTAGNFAPRIIQVAPNSDFEVEVKLDSPVTQRFQIQGLVVQESPNRFIRYDVHHDGSQVRIFAATLVDGVATIRHNVAMAPMTSPIFLRLAREGNAWTPRYSTDGTNWQMLGNFAHAMTVTSVGVFGGNAANSGSPVPAHTLLVDHFFNTASPIEPEPGAPTITTQPIDLAVVEGEPATFSVSASGDAPLTYQWSRNGVPLEGATSASYTIPVTTRADNGSHFVVTVSNAAGSVASRAAKLSLISGGGPLIDVWYGPEQTFGALGVPQWAINVLGNISDPDGLGVVTYSLNGGPAQALSVGPFRRLEAPGDFNVEIPFTSLIPGTNLIEIRAADSLGNQSVETVTVQHSQGNVWPLDYAIDWATTGEIQDVAQIVDGDWGIVGGALRPIQRGYDRLVAVGDLAWTDYEVTVPVTIHGFDAKGFVRPNFKPAVGVMLKWPGHTNWTGSQPAWGYYPAGGGAWYEFEQDGTGSFSLTDFETLEAVDPLSRILSTDVTYIWKVRVESLIGGSTRYSAKVWPAADPEPASWELIGTDANDVEGGSLLLVSHHVDVSFGSVTINPVTSDPNDPPPPPVLHHGVVENVGASWQTVTLPYGYTNPVVVASVRYPNASATPVVTRVRNAFGNQFDLRVQNPSDQPLTGTYSVHYTVAEAGVYTQAQHGIKMEAVKFSSINTNYKGAWWQQEAHNYANSYTAPVVLGQVMSANDPRWSVFWARGDTRNDAPSPTKLSASKHVGEDTVKTRANELIGYLVIESGSGEVGGVGYHAGVSAATIQGIGNTPPFSVPYQTSMPASTAVVSSAGMKITDGGWPVLFGSNPFANGALALAIDEDQLTDAERSHGSEQVAYLVLGGDTGTSAPTVAPPANVTAEATGTLTAVALGTASSSDGSPVTNDAPANGFPLGLNVVTWSATNPDGTGTAEQQVNIVDTTAPQLAVPPDIVTDATGTLTTVELGEATATDLFSPVAIVNNAPSNGFPVGTTAVIWTATDANGNSAEATQSVTAVDGGGGPDNQAPSALDDSASVARGGSVAIDVLANDSDPDGSLDPTSVTVKSSPAHGILGDGGNGVLTYSHDGSATASDSFTYSVRDNQGAESNIATVSIGISGGGGQAAIVSDDFNDGTLDTGVWTFVNPLGDATLLLNGAQAAITAPGATAHDIWTAGNFAPRLMQAAPDADFEVEIKLDSPVTQRFQIQGLIVQESANRFVRFDVHHDGAGVRVFAATLVDGIASIRHNVPTTLSGSPLYLRMARQGDLWIPSYSTDGATWQTLAGFTHVMNVGSIGIFSANSGSPVPAHTALVDHFLNTADPIEPSPGAPTVTPPPNATAEATGTLTAVDLGTATSSDGSPATNDAPADGFPLGLTVVTWSATNADGTGTAEQQVNIVDTTAPQLAVPPDIVTDATGISTAVELGEATATDIFGPVAIVNNAPSDGFPVGTTVVTWTATDANGNGAEAEQSVTILGSTLNQPPVAADDTASVVRGGTVVIDVLANDSDPDGNLDPGTVVIQSLPAFGTLNDDGTGRLTYIHDGSASTTDSFSYSVADTQGAVSNLADVTITITPPDIVSPVFHHGTLSAVDDTWRTVALPYSYANPVVIAAVQYDTPPAVPAIARVRNAAGNSFDVRVQNPGDEPLDAAYTLHYTVVESGVYTLAEHGIKMEATRFTSTQTSGKRNWSAGNTRAYAQSYTNPVVVGQVMSDNDPRWSVFWARGGTIQQPPTSSILVVSKHVGEDFEKTRADETIGYLVIEAGNGVAADTRYTAGLSARTVAGIEGTPPYAVPYHAGIDPTTALVSASAMQGGDGGWPILYGIAPLSAGALDLAFQEDQLADLETAHTTEQVAYLLLQ